MPWTELTLESLRSWMEECVSSAEPRIYHLSSSLNPESLGPASIGFFESLLSFRPIVVPSSGTLELHFDNPELRSMSQSDASMSRFDAIGERIAWTIDRRRLWTTSLYNASPFSTRGRFLYEARFRIEGRRGDIEVIGPGGAFRVYQTGHSFTADVTLRKREGEGIPAAWRDYEAIFTQVRASLQNAGEGSKLRGNFGYFEASKYEFQEWLSLAFAFVIERDPGEGPRLSFSFVEPATRPREEEEELTP